MFFSSNNNLKQQLKSFGLDSLNFDEWIKESVLLEDSNNSNSFSYTGGIPLLPKNFSWPENHLFLLQLDLRYLKNYLPENILNSNFPKNGLLSFFLYYPDLGYYSESEFFKNPNIKAYYFSDFKNLDYCPTQSHLINYGSRENPKEEYMSFPHIKLGFEKSLSLPNRDYHPEFSLEEKYKKSYSKLESEKISKEQFCVSSIFGWASSIQPISNSNYEKMYRFYKNEEKITHLISLDYSFLYIGTIHDMASLSIFIFEKDLLTGNFEKLWAIPHWD